MSEVALAERPLVDGDKQPLPELNAPATNPLLDHAILPTLLRLAWPNVVALSAGTIVVIFETTYIGRLGTEALAAMALVFPFVMLTMTMSGGAMGGGVRLRLTPRPSPAGGRAGSAARPTGAWGASRRSAPAAARRRWGLSRRPGRG